MRAVINECLSAICSSRALYLPQELPDGHRRILGAALAQVVAIGTGLGGAQGASLLLGGAVAAVLSPRAIYALAGLLGLAAAGIVAIASASRTSSRAVPVDATVTDKTPSR